MPLEGAARLVDHVSDELPDLLGVLDDQLPGPGGVAVPAGLSELGVVGDVELVAPVVRRDGLAPQRGDAEPLVGVAELGAAAEPHEVAVVAVARVEARP